MEGGAGEIASSRVNRTAVTESAGEMPLPPRPQAETGAATTSSPTTPRVQGRRGVVQLWPSIRGPVLATALVAASYLLTRTSLPVPDLAPLYLVAVVSIAVVDGSRSAVVSAIILGLYAVYADSNSGHLFTYSRANLLGLAIFITATLVAALLAGAPARRSELLRTELLAQRERLAEALRSKSEFMNAAAHELRTPLSVIVGYVSMLQDETFGRLPDRFRDPIAAMQRKAREVTSLIDEMLLAARVRRGTAPTAPMPVDVREAVRKAVERAEPRVTLEQATLSYELPSTVVAADVDPDHLAYILDNLINNALTYSDGRPWVKLTVAGGSDARVLVKDRGSGVPETMRQKIFEGFVHYVGPESKPKSGRGLGLSISRELAERYGGSLDLVRSELGKGSTFVLRLPAASS
jgi:signal transduction histidine kinase